MFRPYQNETLYIAGPECFYPGGYDLWWAQRKLAEWYGFTVVLPTSTKLALNHEKVQDNAQEIFDDLVEQVKKTTTIVADLEFFRGCEPDGGTLFEMGWVYAKGGKCYGYTRDMRRMTQKNQNARMLDGVVIDQNGWPHPYGNLPFCPAVVGSSKLVEGTFEDCIKMLRSDLDETRRLRALGYKIDRRPVSRKFPKQAGRKLLFLSGPDRYRTDAKEWYGMLARRFIDLGYDIVSPVDFTPPPVLLQDPDPYALAVAQFQFNLDMIEIADGVVADLSNFHGLEPNGDTGFECGYAFGKGKKCLALMDDARIMQKRIPGYDEHGKFVDMNGYDIENFNYPINLMFACSMPVIEGSLTDMEETIADFFR